MTFYYHFKDIYDLVEWCCEEDAARALAGQKTYDTWQQGFLQILEALRKDKAFFTSVYRSISREQLENYLYRLTYDRPYLFQSELRCGYRCWRSLRPKSAPAGRPRLRGQWPAAGAVPARGWHHRRSAWCCSRRAAALFYSYEEAILENPQHQRLGTGIDGGRGLVSTTASPWPASRSRICAVRWASCCRT